MNQVQVCGQAAVEIGIPVPTTVAGASDLQARQLGGLYNSLGQSLVDDHPWQRMKRTHTFTTVAGQALYPLPPDWGGPSDQTEWDTTNHWPLHGQATDPQWAYLKGGIVAQGPRIVYRIRDNQFEIFPNAQADGWALSFEYFSTGWCYDPLIPAVRKDFATLDTDIAMFPDRLMIAGVKLKFWQIKGFDTTALQADYDGILASTMGRDQGAPVLSLSPRPTPYFIGVWNVPDGSWNVT